MQQLGCTVRHEAGLFSWFGKDRIARSESRRDLSGVDRERKVPGRNAKRCACGCIIGRLGCIVA